MGRSLKVKLQCILQVKQAVKRNGFATQQLLAEELGIARSTVSNFLNGKPVDYLNFYEISTKLNQDIQEIADWNDSENEITPLNQTQSNEEERIRVDFSRYVERPPIEQICYETVSQPGSLLRIKSTKGMGKTLLIDNILSKINQEKYKVVNLTFLQASKSILSNSDKLLKWFSLVISKKINLSSKFKEHWEEGLGLYSCTSYFEDYLLKYLQKSLILVIEDIDRLFSYQEIADDFLSLFRVWHEEAKTNRVWRKLHLVISYSTEEYTPTDINKSPFNVGTEVLLRDFVSEEILILVNKYNPKLTEEEMSKIISIVGGHPYLLQKALYAITQKQISLEHFESTAATEEGIYAHHLRGHLLNLQEHPELMQGMKKIVECSYSIDLGTKVNFQLHSLGLVELKHNSVKPRYKIYADYFAHRLSERSNT